MYYNYDHMMDIIRNWCFEETLGTAHNQITKNAPAAKKPSVLEIKNYTYNPETGETYIQWSDKTETTVKAEENAVKDQFTGFMTAVAKKAMGNTSRINNLYDKWAIKKPEQDKKAEEKRLADEAEAKRIDEKRRAKREKWIVNRTALQRKRDYEARQIANQKYGVPMDF